MKGRPRPTEQAGRLRPHRCVITLRGPCLGEPWSGTRLQRSIGHQVVASCCASPLTGLCSYVEVHWCESPLAVWQKRPLCAVVRVVGQLSQLPSRQAFRCRDRGLDALVALMRCTSVLFGTFWSSKGCTLPCDPVCGPSVRATELKAGLLPGSCSILVDAGAEHCRAVPPVKHHA